MDEIETTNATEHTATFHYGRLRYGGRPGNPNLAPRCQAHRKNGEPCRAPAVRGRRTCRMHGGTSKGPVTPEGLARSKRAGWIHGYYSEEAREQRQRERAETRELVRQMRQLSEELERSYKDRQKGEEGE